MGCARDRSVYLPLDDVGGFGGGIVHMLMLHASQARPELKLPRQRELAAIASTCGPATILYVAKTSAYLLIQATATSMSTLALAAHQPVWSVWGLVSGPGACVWHEAIFSSASCSYQFVTSLCDESLIKATIV